MFAPILLFLTLLAPVTQPDAHAVGEFYEPRSAAYQALFFAVLEGAYRDGLSSDDLEIILTRREGRPYEYFVYGCPLCTPTVAALELYRNRPATLYGLKNVGSTFGSGLPAEIATGLRGEDAGERLTSIRHLLERWIETYLVSRQMDAGERIVWRNRIDAARQEGDRLLRQYRESGSVSMTAPAFAETGSCAVCSGAGEGASRAAGEALPLMTPLLRERPAKPPAPGSSDGR